MIKHLFFLTGLFLLAKGLCAQSDPPVVLVSAPAKAWYKPAATAKKSKVASGAALKMSGSLELGGNLSAIVFYGGRFQVLQGKGPHAMSAVFSERSELSSLNFDAEFGFYVEAAVQMAGNIQGADGWGTPVADKPKTGDGWGTPPADKPKTADGWGVVADKPKTADGWGTPPADKPKTADGWGGKGKSITPILPFGKVRAETVRFLWSKPAGAGTFQLLIEDENKQIVHSATGRDTFLSVDLRSLNLTPDVLYSWSVKIAEAPELSSESRIISLASEDDYTKAVQKASNSKIYAGADPVLRGLMEAVALEKAALHNAAAQTYSNLAQKHKSNNLLKMMRAAFWMRYGLEPYAKKALNP